MLLEIQLGQSDVTLKLLKNRQVLDFETAKYYHDLSEVLTPLEVVVINKKGWIKKDNTVIYQELLTGLISALDKLLRRNNIDIKSLKSYKIYSDLGQDSTSYKIASAFIEALKFRYF